MDSAPATADRRRRRRVSDERMLDAAVREFARHGFAGASMGAVAERAGTTKPTLYANFGSKEELFAASVAAETAALRAELLGTYAESAGRSVREQLNAGTRVFFRYAAERPDGFELLFGGAPGLPLDDATTRTAHDDVIAAVTELVRPRLTAEGGSEAQARLVATMVVAVIHAAARAAVLDGLDHDAAAAMVEAFVLRGLGGLDRDVVALSR